MPPNFFENWQHSPLWNLKNKKHLKLNREKSNSGTVNLSLGAGILIVNIGERKLLEWKSVSNFWERELFGLC